MRQLILVEDFSISSAALLDGLARAELPATPVVVYETGDLRDHDGPTAASSPVESLQELNGETFTLSGREGLFAVTAHHGGLFPERLGERARSLLTTCDTVVARCPRRDVVSAARFYSSFLYALDGQLEPANLRSATAHLLGLVDRARNTAARHRHDLLDLPADEPVYAPRGEAARLANSAADEDATAEATVFETAYGDLSAEIARLGFELADRKVREGRRAVTILVGSPGIAVYGPYVALEEGDYRFRVEAEGGERDIAFTLEAAWNAGSQVLAVHRYAFDGVGRAFADLAFSVAGPAVGRGLELRLWNDEASAQFDLVRLSLVRTARPW